jgi:hypothetical protein
MLARAAGAGGFEAGNPAFTFRGSRSIVASVGRRESVQEERDTRASHLHNNNHRRTVPAVPA